MEPPNGTPTERIVFWFLHWYQERCGEDFTFKHQVELANAAGVPSSTLSDMLKSKPTWLEATDKRAHARST
jgi:hypothetical protein